jgi:hypothetical protein
MPLENWHHAGAFCQQGFKENEDGASMTMAQPVSL